MKKSLYSQKYSRFTTLLRQARHDAGLTQSQLAQRLDRPQSFVAKVEAGERRLDVVEFLEVMQVLNQSPETLLRRLRRAT